MLGCVRPGPKALKKKKKACVCHSAARWGSENPPSKSPTMPPSLVRSTGAVRSRHGVQPRDSHCRPRPTALLVVAANSDAAQHSGRSGFNQNIHRDVTVPPQQPAARHSAHFEREKRECARYEPSLQTQANELWVPVKRSEQAKSVRVSHLLYDLGHLAVPPSEHVLGWGSFFLALSRPTELFVEDFESNISCNIRCEVACPSQRTLRCGRRSALYEQELETPGR